MRWAGRIALVLLGVAIGAAAGLYGWSEWALHHDVGVPLRPIVADRSPAGIAEGARLARIDGCMGCHRDGHGGRFVDAPMFAVLDAPSFASLTARADDAHLARAIRQGVSIEGRPLFVMPPHPVMADEDVARLIGYLRTLRPAPGDVVRTRRFGPLGRLAIVRGTAPFSAHPPLIGFARRPADVGAYFAEGTCIGCHRMDAPHEMGPADTAPPLAMVAASYDDAAFRRLLRTGVAASGHETGLMSEVAKGGLHLLSDGEIAAIHAYLRGRATAMPAQ